jgi:hypothetical protein
MVKDASFYTPSALSSYNCVGRQTNTHIQPGISSTHQTAS